MKTIQNNLATRHKGYEPLQLSMRRLSDIAEYLIGDHGGIIEYVKEVRRAPGAPSFFHFYARACDVSAFTTQPNSRNSGGASAVREIAMAKAIGEAIERYCSAVYEPQELPLTSYEAARFQCVKPAEFALYITDQYQSPNFPYVPFEDTSLVRWTPTSDLLSGALWYVPAAMVYMPYFYDTEHGERPIADRISTGLACHCSLEEAAISAICEVIERDAFTITWQAKLAMPQILLETISEANKDLVDRFARIGSSVTLFDLTIDHGIPTILAVLRDTRPDQPEFVFAASTSLDPEQATRKSLEELAHSRHLAHQLKTQLPELVTGPNYENVLNADDHVHLYCDHRNSPLGDFLFASTTRVHFQAIKNLSTGERKQDLTVLGQKVHSIDQQILLADLTTPEVRDLGLAVMRAVIPGFHPLFIGHQRRALGGSRLWAVPQKLGHIGITRQTGDNPAPHPYP